MSIHPDDQRQIDVLATWLEQNQANIPNADRFIQKLEGTKTSALSPHV